MKKILCVTSIALLSSLCLDAEGLNQRGLNQNSYLGLRVGITDYKEKDDLKIDNSYTYLLTGSLKANRNIRIDLSAGLNQSDIEYTDYSATAEYDSIIFGIDLLYHFLPNEKIDPYISVGYGKQSYKIDFSNGNKVDESDNAYRVETGAQMELSKSIILGASVDYEKWKDDAYKSIDLNIENKIKDGIFVGGGISIDDDGDDITKSLDVYCDYELYNKIFIGGAISRNIDEKDMLYSVGFVKEF